MLPGLGRQLSLSAVVGPLLAVLGRSRGLSRRSWADLGTSVGGLGLGPLSELLKAVLGRLLFEWLSQLSQHIV